VARRREWTLERLAEGVRGGDRLALARAITLVENSEPLAYELVHDLYPDTGRAYAVGVTGPPGVGKSSLVSALIRQVRPGGTTIGVISVDPSSPFTQGALLGDRIRLSDHFLDPEVFIRSMGTRGHLGGLAEATLQAALVLDAAGKDLLFLETVGTGQSEVEIVTIADTILLVLMPGSGDSIQALKAGIMEIPDVIAVNKSDHPAAQTMVNEVQSVLALDADRDWQPPIVLTEATRGEGIDELWDALRAHRAHLGAEGRLERRRAANLAAEVLAVSTARARSHLERSIAADPELAALLERVQVRELDPLAAVHEIMERVLGIDGDENTADVR
jgi:GTPase